ARRAARRPRVHRHVHPAVRRTGRDDHRNDRRLRGRGPGRRGARRHRDRRHRPARGARAPAVHDRQAGLAAPRRRRACRHGRDAHRGDTRRRRRPPARRGRVGRVRDAAHARPTDRPGRARGLRPERDLEPRRAGPARTRCRGEGRRGTRGDVIARLVRRASAVGALLVLAGCAASPSPAYEVTAVECASAAVPRPDDRAFTPLGDEILTMTGWSHTSPAETSLALEHTRYGLRRSAFLPDPTCADRSTLEIVLVKRPVDWDRQHVNGLEATWPTRSVRFSDVTDVTLVLRLLPGLSSIPGPEALAGHFAGVLEP